MISYKSLLFDNKLFKSLISYKSSTDCCLKIHFNITHRLLIEALEKSLKHTSGEHLCEKLYKGLIVNQIKCLNCNNLSEREEHFYDINVQIIGCESLTSSLKQYCAAEVLEGDSAYQCDTCKSKQRALRSTVLRDLPPILTFSCNRFKIDRTTNWQRQKVTSKSAFPLLLDMSRFVEGSPGFSEEVQEVEKEVEHEKYLRSSMVWVDDVAARARVLAEVYTDKYGSSITYKMLSEVEKCDVSRTLRSSAASSSSSSSSSSPSASNGIHDGADGNHLYELFAAIMHCGSAHSGHYFAYIRDTLHESEWGLPESHYKNISMSHRTRFRTRVRTVGGVKNEHEQDENLSIPSIPIIEGTPITSNIVNIQKLNKNIASESYYVNSNACMPQDVSYFTTKTGMTYIDIDSVLGFLSNIVYRAKIEQLGRERKTLIKARRKAELKARNHDKSRGPHDVISNHQVEVEVGAEIGEEVLEMPSVQIKNINDLISLKLGRGSWNSLYEKENGQIEHFTSLHTEIFSLEAESGLLSMPRYASMTWVTREILEEVFKFDDRIARDNAFEAAHNAAATATGAADGASTLPIDADSATLLSCDNDAALALALQLSLNEDSNSTSFSKGSGGGAGGTASGELDEWVPASQKKKGGKGKPKEKDKDKDKDKEKEVEKEPSVQSTKELTAPQGISDPINEEEDELCAAERRFSDEILSKHYGQYFEFNDTTVSAMPLEGLEKAFEGKESAYILVYRKVEKEVVTDVAVSCVTKEEFTDSIVVDNSGEINDAQLKFFGAAVADGNVKNSADTTPHTGVGHGLGSRIRIPPPQYWSDKVTIDNKEMEDERIKYNSLTHTAKIKFLTPVHVTFSDPLLLNVRAGVTSNKSTAIPVQYADSIDMTIDLRMSVSDVKKAFLAECSAFTNALDIGSCSPHCNNGIRNGSSNSGSNSEDIHSTDSSPILTFSLSVLQIFGDGFHPDLPLSPDAVIGDVISSSGTLLAWNGRTIGTYYDQYLLFLKQLIIAWLLCDYHDDAGYAIMVHAAIELHCASSFAGV